MKKIFMDFIRRGLIACGFGPIVFAILYMILQEACEIQTLSVNEMCLGIFSLSALAFIAGGINVIYQIERLPFIFAVLIHGCVLYICYLITYLINGWLEWGRMPILVFSGIFVFGYFVIWALIYYVTKNRTYKINQILKEKQKAAGDMQ